MPLRRHATPTGYSPEQIAILVSAHEAACAAPGVEQVNSANGEAIALKVLELAAKGEFDLGRLRDYAVHALRTNGNSGALTKLVRRPCPDVFGAGGAYRERLLSSIVIHALMLATNTKDIT
jgi:hypothetical protein